MCLSPVHTAFTAVRYSALNDEHFMYMLFIAGGEHIIMYRT